MSECDKCGKHAVGCEYVDREVGLELLNIVDKNSTFYFMTQMTQEEFEERRKGIENVPYEFNKIKR